MTLVPRAIAVFLLSSISMFAQDWPYVGRDHGGTRHSSLAQINRTNVAKLEIAWTFDTEDWSDGKDLPSRSSFEANAPEPEVYPETDCLSQRRLRTKPG
jgi:hypothetical protein